MTVTRAYMQTCNQIGLCLGWSLVGVALGGAAGCAAAQILGVKLTSGIIFGAASASSALFAFKKCNLASRVSYCCEIASSAATGLAIGTAAGYATLNLAQEVPAPETFFKLAAATYGLGLTAFLCLRATCQSRSSLPEAPPPHPPEEAYMYLNA